MPNREVIEKWVAALESGEYSQGKRTLYRTIPHPTELLDPDYQAVGYCCLGVLCDLAVKAEVIPPPVMGLRGEAEFGKGHTSFLPEEVREWAGVSQNPEVNYESESPWSMGEGEPMLHTRRGMLSDLNDDHGMTFPEIAGIIRENFLAHADAGQPA